MTPAQPPAERERRPAGNGTAASQGGEESPTVAAELEKASLIRGADAGLARRLAEAADEELATRSDVAAEIARDIARVARAVVEGRPPRYLRNPAGCCCGCLSRRWFDDPNCIRHTDPGAAYRAKVGELRELEGRTA